MANVCILQYCRKSVIKFIKNSKILADFTLQVSLVEYYNNISLIIATGGTLCIYMILQELLTSAVLSDVPLSAIDEKDVHIKSNLP